MIRRDYYLNQIEEFIDTEYVKLLIGVRRSGKSTLLKMIKKLLIEQEISIEQIVEIDFESMHFDGLKNGIALHDWLDKKIINDKKYYL